MGENVVREQIDPRILEALFAYFPNAEIAMLELTDNAIGDRILGEKMVLTVRVTPSRIMVLNKGGWGMGIDQLRNFMTWGRSEASGVFRFFGQGGKAAIGYLGKRFTITTYPKAGDRSYIIAEKEDWTKRADGQLKEYPVAEDKKLIFDTGRVEISIHSLTRKPHVKKLRYLLESTYSQLLHSGELKILFNDKWLSPEVLKYVKFSSFEDETPFGKVWGRLGIKEDGLGGIRCYSQKRLITQKEIFNLDPTKYDLSKLVGEINLDFVPVVPNKISFDKSGREWKAVEKVIVKRAGPFLAEIKSMGEVPAHLKRMQNEVNDFVNKALREADTDFETKGRSPPAKVTEITLKAAKPVEPKVPKVGEIPEPKTPASPEARGTTSRLGRIEVELKAFDEHIRCQIIDNKTRALINITYPAAKHYGFRRTSWKLYCLESVALELYQERCTSAKELVDKITDLLSREFS